MSILRNSFKSRFTTREIQIITSRMESQYFSVSRYVCADYGRKRFASYLIDLIVNNIA